MRSVVIDAAALDEKQAAFFSSKDASVATGLLIGRMAGPKDYIVSVQLRTRACMRGRVYRLVGGIARDLRWFVMASFAETLAHTRHKHQL